MNKPNQPWHRRARRWGQTNLTEDDPQHYDDAFWRAYWKQTHCQGVIVNAGGIVAYYPSRFELQYRAEHLGHRDLFGEVVAAAREEGLAVLARMDSNRATGEVFEAHPDWFARDRDGEPIRARDRFTACVNSPYYSEYIPGILREIIERYQPDGFTDNSWTGLGFHTICHCQHCRRGFRDDEGKELPVDADWTDPVYRRWVRWNYRIRVRNWKLNNRVTREAGGPDCLWLGMVNANPMATHLNFCDLLAVCEDMPVVMTDHQSRDSIHGYERNGLNGKLLHELAGWDALIPESMAHYVRGTRPFRKASMPALDVQTWIQEGVAGGISPWWHHIGAHHEDRRQFSASLELHDWHRRNEDLLYDREPVANAGLVWSQDNIDFFGREEVTDRVAMPWRGWTRALTRARIPFLPVHADRIDSRGTPFDLLILPCLAAMSNAQVAAVRAHVEGGGSLIATGNSGFLDEDGEPREAWPLADLLGFEPTGERLGADGKVSHSWEVQQAHNYLRLRRESVPETFRNAWNDTDWIPFGGTLWEGRTTGPARVPLTYIPAFPIYPPEFSWPRERETDIPALLLGESGDSRTALAPIDIDRCYGRGALPDQGDLLSGLVRWALRDRLPVRVSGPGYLDLHCYRQENRLILHLINLSGANRWPEYREEVFPVGPLTIEIAGEVLETPPVSVRSRVSGFEFDLTTNNSGWTFTIPSVDQHECLDIV